MQQLSRIVGDNLKSLRSQQGLSLEQLAASSGVSKSRLGQIERGEANPSISTVWQIANALKVEFSALVTSRQTGSVVVTRADVEPLVEDDGRCRNYPLFPFDAALGFEVYELELEPGGRLSSEAHPGGVQETITVASGQLCVRVACQEHELGTGDAIRFDADSPHEYTNPGAELTVLSMVVAYPRVG